MEGNASRIFYVWVNQLLDFHIVYGELNLQQRISLIFYPYPYAYDVDKHSVSIKHLTPNLTFPTITSLHKFYIFLNVKIIYKQLLEIENKNLSSINRKK